MLGNHIHLSYVLLCLFQIQLQLQVRQRLLKDTEGRFFLSDPRKVTQI